MRFNTKMRLKSRPQYQKLNKYDKIQLAWFHKPHKNLPRSVQGTVVAASTQCHSQTSISWNTMKHSDSLHRVCFIHLYTAICAASRILSLIAWAIVKRWKEFGIKQVRICKTHSFSHWTRWIQTIVELSGAHFERVVRHIPCCFKMCQNMSTFFEHETYEKNWKDALNSPRLSALGPIVPILSALIVPPSPWILQTDHEALNVGSLYFFTNLSDFFETKIVHLYDSYDTHIMTSYEIIWYIWSACSHIHYLGVGNIEFWMYLTIRETLGVTRASHELIAYPPTQRLKLAMGLQRLGYAYAIIIR